ncbi:MAG: prolyl-tRNA synthetase associated domain-containing protein [SAR324 cluster bacterium]|nr:prolyl-tRNA synthetase associated domain-containing protein [SAR324 cluster bacterium]
MTDIYKFLDSINVSYERFDHPAVYTVSEAKKLSPEMDGASTKNLFLRDKKGIRHFLVVVPQDKQVDLKELSSILEASRLSFASPDRLKKYLGIEPGSVSILALLNDPEKTVEVFVDNELWNAEIILCHPLVNTSTLAITRDGIKQFLEKTGHNLMLVEIPIK